ARDGLAEIDLAAHQRAGLIVVDAGRRAVVGRTDLEGAGLQDRGRGDLRRAAAGRRRLSGRGRTAGQGEDDDAGDDTGDGGLLHGSSMTRAGWRREWVTRATPADLSNDRHLSVDRLAFRGVHPTLLHRFNDLPRSRSSAGCSGVELAEPVLREIANVVKRGLVDEQCPHHEVGGLQRATLPDAAAGATLLAEGLEQHA